MDNDKIWELSVGKVNHSLEAADKKEFEEIKDSEEAKKALQQAVQIYAKTSKSFLIRQIDKEKNWNYINRQIRLVAPAGKLIIHFLRYAAVFLVALLIGIMIPKLFSSRSQETTNNRIEMEWGQMSKMTLSDGTQVWLNAGTTFEYPTTFDTQTRSVVLNGEAQFKVTHREKIPFEVKTRSGIIKVYGTTFNVSSYADDPELVVTLIEGKITVENSNGDYLAALNPSEQLSINKSSGQIILRKVDTEFYSSWIDGKILLNETKLSDLTAILKRWYNVDIQLLGENVGDIQISGTISKGKPLDLFLKILERMYSVKYKMITNNDKKDEVIIYKN